MQYTVEWNCGSCEATHEVTLSGSNAQVIVSVILVHLLERDFKYMVFAVDEDGTRREVTQTLDAQTLILVTMDAV